MIVTRFAEANAVFAAGEPGYQSGATLFDRLDRSLDQSLAEGI